MNDIMLDPGTAVAGVAGATAAVASDQTALSWGRRAANLLSGALVSAYGAPAIGAVLAIQDEHIKHGIGFVFGTIGASLLIKFVTWFSTLDVPTLTVTVMNWWKSRK
jgi:hypothetical protein